MCHNIITGRLVTGIIHFVNKIPIDWYSKKQSTVETATYGSEHVSAKTCVEQIIDLRNTLRYLGVSVKERSFTFGDNRLVVDSSMTPHARIHKRHVALSFHRVREAIAAKIVGCYFVPGEINPADMLSKHWGYSQVWTMLQPLLFWTGDTADLIKKGDDNKESNSVNERKNEGIEVPSSQRGVSRIIADWPRARRGSGGRKHGPHEG